VTIPAASPLTPPRAGTGRSQPGQGGHGSTGADQLPPAAAPSHHGVPAHLRGEWGLFTDWCRAAGRSPLPADADTVLAFGAALPASHVVTARRASAIHAAHASAGLIAPVRHRPVSTTRTVGRRLAGPNTLPAGPALRGLPVFDYPAAVPARRDAVLVLMCLVLRWSRRQARQAHAKAWPVPRLGDIDLPLGADPWTCPSCVLTRWLRVLAADVGGGRQEAEAVIATSDRWGHDCHDEVPDGWQRIPLLPPVDRHGWIDGNRTLTPRSISARLHRAALAPPAPSAGTAAPQASAALIKGRRDHAALAELEVLLTRLESALDNVALCGQTSPGSGP